MGLHRVVCAVVKEALASTQPCRFVLQGALAAVNRAGPRHEDWCLCRSQAADGTGLASILSAREKRGFPGGNRAANLCILNWPSMVRVSCVPHRRIAAAAPRRRNASEAL